MARRVGEVALAENVFGAQVNEYAIHEMIVAQLANLRQGTQSALTRSEVRGGGIKPWRQKGTGRARQGLDEVSAVETRRRGFRSKAQML